jgi:hypothetical protein
MGKSFINKTLQIWLRILALGGLIGTFCTYFWYNWMGAYFTPTKSILMTINDYGEAQGELIMGIIFSALILWFFFDYIKMQKRDYEVQVN